MSRRGKRKILTAALLTLALLGGCTYRAAQPAGTSAPAPTPTATVEPAPTDAPEYLVTYLVDGEVVYTQPVAQGAFPEAYEAPESDAGAFLGWLDENGESVEPAEIAVNGDAVYTARLAPALDAEVFYLSARGGLFRPDAALTRLEAADMLYALLQEKPAIPADADEGVYHAELIPAAALCNTREPLANQDVAADNSVQVFAQENPRRDSYGHLAALCAAGYMRAGEDGALQPDEALTAEDLRTILAGFFPGEALDAVLPAGEEAVSRLETARALNALLERTTPAENAGAFFADVAEDDPALDDMRAAAAAEEAEPGMVLLPNGQLYCIDEDGRLLRDADVGRLHFGPDGRYTSGDETLDALVEDAVAHLVNVNDVHESQLRSVYDYIRDNFVYLRAGNYAMGEHGWEIEEATDFLSTHRGNCYSFAAGLWALARGIGYDANAISGFQGENNAPHGWIDITLENGTRYFFDVEAEYAVLRDGANYFPMFKLPWSVSVENRHYTFDWVVEGFPLYW